MTPSSVHGERIGRIDLLPADQHDAASSAP